MTAFAVGVKPMFSLPYRGAARVALAGLGVALAYFVVRTLGVFGGPADSSFEVALFTGIVVASAALCVARGVIVDAERGAWLCMGAGISLWAAGETYYNYFLPQVNTPFPSWADAGYLLFYLPVYAALFQLASTRIPRLRSGLWLDGLVGALAVATMTAALLFGPVSSMTAGPPSVIATTLAYPIADLMLLGMMAVTLGLAGWRLERSLALIMAALAAFWMADSAFLIKVAHEGYTAGGTTDAGWAVAAVLLAAAAWMRPRAASEEALEGLRAGVAAPMVCATVAAGLLLYGNFFEVNALAQLLAAGTLLCVLGRMWQVFRRSAEQAGRMTELSLTDALTGLGNRRKLVSDVEEVLAALERRAETPKAFVIADINGFKAYNDTFGHPAGDALLVRLAHALREAVAGSGTVYRLGGDEFCMLLEAGEGLERLLGRVSDALRERGPGYCVDAAHGMTVLPTEASTVAEAMRFADRRMYAQKAGGRQSVGAQMRDVLLSALSERSAELGEHNAEVAELARGVAHRMHLTSEQVEEVVRAAELHDVGKVAVPDAILFKPGPLTAAEWDAMKMHTLVGERIIAASAALKPVGRLVRSSHERYDGGGYPDGLAGEMIPLGARIVAVCDAYDAMVSDRPYRASRSEDEALAELQACAGSQFDPQVVKVFCSLMSERRRGRRLSAAGRAPQLVLPSGT